MEQLRIGIFCDMESIRRFVFVLYKQLSHNMASRSLRLYAWGCTIETIWLYVFLLQYSRNKYGIETKTSTKTLIRRLKLWIHSEYLRFFTVISPSMSVFQLLLFDTVSRFGEHRSIYRAAGNDSEYSPLQSMNYGDATVSLRHPRLKQALICSSRANSDC